MAETAKAALSILVKQTDIEAYDHLLRKFLEWAAIAKEKHAAEFSKVIATIGLYDCKFAWNQAEATLSDGGLVRVADAERMLLLLRQLPEAKAELEKKKAAQREQSGLFK